MTKITRIIDTECRVCGSPNDAHAPVSMDQSTPANGDLSMCAYCGTLSTYVVTDEKITLSPVSDEEMKELWKVPEIREAMAIGRRITERFRG